MPGIHITRMVNQAKVSLEEWLAVNDRLCDFKRSDFSQPYPYSERHMQSLYILRYYPAYFAENYLMYEMLLNDGLIDPIIESIGCGCMVDCAAAAHVYGEIVPYTGYDMVDWHIKAAEIDGKVVELRVGDVLTVDNFYSNSNVFHFSRSIGDLAQIMRGLGRKVGKTTYTSDTIYVCATYRATNLNISNDMRTLHLFANQFKGYEQTDSTIFYPAGQMPPLVSGIVTNCRWFVHPEVPYCQSLLERCSKPTPTCPENHCRRWVCSSPMLRLNNLAFEILKLRRP